MAPSQMEQQQQSLGQGYTHKKFNCGYSHKKLGMRLRNRQQEENKENVEINYQTPAIEENESSKPTKGLFRPYALDENNTPRKRKISRSSEETIKSCNTSTPATLPTPYISLHQLGASYSSPAPAQTCVASPALSPNSYALRLQRQRAALYMRYMSQFSQQSPLQTANAAIPAAFTHYAPMGYPNVTAPIFNSC